MLRHASGMLLCAVCAGSTFGQVATDWDPHWVGSAPFEPLTFDPGESIHAVIEFDHDNNLDTRPSLFIGGDFVDLNGDSTIDYLARWDAEAGAWVSVGSFDGPVFTFLLWDDNDDESDPLVVEPTPRVWLLEETSCLRMRFSTAHRASRSGIPMPGMISCLIQWRTCGR